jgi:hypothetical protein
VDQAVQEHIERSLESLLHAVQVVYDQESSKAQDTSPKALSMLADTALAEPPTPHLPQIRTDPNMQHPHRTLLPTPSQVPPPPSGMAHGPTDPRSFILPRPSPILSQPRHLLPARQQLGLPDPFAMNGPPQLPPPPGSNFRSLPLPNYLPPPGPPGPPSMYFQSPHGHGHGPPPPPPRRY